MVEGSTGRGGRPLHRVGAGFRHATRVALLLLGLGGSGPLMAVETALPASPVLEVMKLPTCGCCGTWIKYLEASGFVVKATNVQDLVPVRQQAGVSEAIAGCHTASIDGYVIEGHVSAEKIRQLLRDRPPIKGLVVTGMPRGSPGMEGPGAERYDVLALQNDGTTTVYAAHEVADGPADADDGLTSTGDGAPPTAAPSTATHGVPEEQAP